MINRLAIAIVTVGVVAAAFLLSGAVAPVDSAEAARLNNIGVAYMNQQLFEKALKTFNEATAKDPGMKVVALNRGVALMNLQKIDEAKVLLEQAAKDAPNDAHPFYNIGLFYKNSADPEKAIAAFGRVAEIDPNDADTWYFLGSTHAQLKQFPEAIAAFEHALKLDPLHASTQFGLARAYQQSGQTDRAHEAMKKFQYITQNKLGSPISLVYGEQGKYSRAEESPVAVAKVPAEIAVRFVDVTREAGLITRSAEEKASKELDPGVCFLDYDGDGKIDLFLSDNGTETGISLYHNLGGGKFEDATRQMKLDPTLHALGCTAGDYDNDGFSDLAVTFADRVLLLHNEKGKFFRDVTGVSGIESKGSPIGVTLVDYDHDGDLDLYVLQSAKGHGCPPQVICEEFVPALNRMWRNNGNGTFTDQTEVTGLAGESLSLAAVGTDYNNDRAVDLVVAGPTTVFENPREGKFAAHKLPKSASSLGVSVLDFDHDGWMDLALTNFGARAITLWRNDKGKAFEMAPFPETNLDRAYGIVAFDYDNDGWVDLAAVGETKDGKGEVRLFRNLGPDGWKDVTADVGLDKIQLREPRAIVAGDYDNDGAVDLVITQNHGLAVLLRNEGGNKNNSLRVALKGLNDNKSAIGTKVEVFAGGLRQKFEVYGSSGYLGQNSPYLTIGLGQAKEADVVRMLWPTGVLQDEIELAANKVQNILEIDRRGSSCPTLFAWDGTHYALVGDMLGAGVVGHWVGPSPEGLKPQLLNATIGTTEAVPFPKSVDGNSVDNSSLGERNIPRPVEYIKVDAGSLRVKEEADSSGISGGSKGSSTPQDVSLRDTICSAQDDSGRKSCQGKKAGILSFRFMEPLEESVYLDSVELLAVDHPREVDVYPNEYFASNPPYPAVKVVFSNKEGARPPAGAWDEHGHDVLPDLLAHRYVGDFKVLSFLGFTEPHTLELDLGEAYRGGPLWLLMHGEIEYFSATSMYAADQAHLTPFAPYVEALLEPSSSPQRLKPQNGKDGPGAAETALLQGTGHREGKWVRVVDDLGFPAGGARTMTADLTGKLPVGTRRIRLTTNLQIYWDNILISRTNQRQQSRVTAVPLARAELGFHGFPLKIEDQPPGNVKYIYEKASATGPYTRPAGAYTRYGDVRALLAAVDDKFVVFGSGDEVALDFDPARLPALPHGWVRDYFFAAHGYEKDMDFYAYHGDEVEPLPFGAMGTYPYAGTFPADDEHFNYQLEYNTRFMSGKEARGYSFQYSK
jgi:tetratricopeptide (TPR) repeat protein